MRDFVIYFLKPHAEPGWHERISEYEQAGYITDQEFMDFVAELSKSSNPIISFYGHYALFVREYYGKVKQNGNLSDLLNGVGLLTEELHQYCDGKEDVAIRKELEELKQQIERILAKDVNEQRVTTQQAVDKKRMHLPPQHTTQTYTGRLAFKKIEFKYREASGRERPISYRFWDDHHGWRSVNAFGCGDLLDVMWSPKSVMYVKEKDILEEILTSETAGTQFDDAVWDGEHIWVGTPKKGIWVLDTSGKIIRKIDESVGLPPAERGIRLALIRKGEIFAVGSFGPYGRAWCAIVSFKDSKVLVNIFHEATLVKDEQDKPEELITDPNFTFSPYWVYHYYDKATNRNTLLVARCERKYGRNSPFRYPLEIDLDSLAVRVSTIGMLELGKESSLYGIRIPQLEYNGKIYKPGSLWYRADPNTNKWEKLTKSILPAPYRNLDRFYISAHYGIVGCGSDTGGIKPLEFYKVVVGDEYQDMLAGSTDEGTYFHTFGFEDENGPITNPFLLELIHIEINQPDGIRKIYNYDDVQEGGYFPLGAYRAVSGQKSRWTGKKTEVLQSGPYRPITVTAESPLHLVFKSAGTQEVVYEGQVVDAMNGKPIENVLITAIKGGTQLGSNSTTKTDYTGRFEAIFKRNESLYSFIASKDEYMDVELTRRGFTPEENQIVKLRQMRLFPAAKVKMYPCILEYNSGRPCLEAKNVNCWLHFICQDGNDSEAAANFFGMYGGYTSEPEVPSPSVLMNSTRTYKVPAGFSYKLEFDMNLDDKWAIPNIPYTINLRQGEVFDIGRFIFEPLLEISVRVITAAGYPINGVRIKNITESSPLTSHKTDNNGIAILYVKPHSQQKVILDFSDVYINLHHELFIDVGSREEAAKGFTIILLENGGIEFLKTLEPVKTELSRLKVSESTTSKLDEVTFTTGITAKNYPLNNLTEISINEECIYVHTKWLLTLEDHEVVIKLFDDSGKLINEYRNDRAPYNPVWYIWTWYKIDRKSDKPGKWKCEVYLDGQKMGEKYLTVLP